MNYKPQTQLRSGQALVLALVAIGFLTAIIGATSMILLGQSRINRHERHRQKAYYAARAGLEVGLNLLKEDDTQHDALSDTWNVAGDAARGQIPTGSFHIGQSPGMLENGIVDAERKLNINTASTPMLRKLSPQITDDVARQLVERRQEKLFTTHNELMHFWVNNLTGPGNTNTPPAYLQHTTVYGDGTININTASRSVLRCVPGFSPNVVDKIVEHRNGPDGQPATNDDAPYKDLSALRQSLDVNRKEWNAAKDRITTSSSSFIIRTQGQAGTSHQATASTESVVVRTSHGLTIIEHRRNGSGINIWEKQP